MVPFAQLEPVQVSGVTVKLATLHNEEDLRRKDVRDGDEVIVMRAGDVIPQVVSPTAKAQKRKGRSDPPSPPERCPACDTPTIKPEGGVWTICPNRTGCPGQVFQAVKHFVGAMDIEGLGEENARRFLDIGLIENMADIYDLTVERLDRARRLRGGLGPESGRGDRGLEEAALPPGAVRARHPRHRVRERTQPGPATALDGRAARRLGGGADRGGGDGADHGQDRARDPGGGTHARADRAPARPQPADGGGGARAAAEGPLVGKTVVLTGTMPNLTRPRGDRSGSRRPAAR